VVTDIFLAVVD